MLGKIQFLYLMTQTSKKSLYVKMKGDHDDIQWKTCLLCKANKSNCRIKDENVIYHAIYTPQ